MHKPSLWLVKVDIQGQCVWQRTATTAGGPAHRLPVADQVLAHLYAIDHRLFIGHFAGLFRQLVANEVEGDEGQIGGEGVIVEIDESKFGKRKYHRGHRVEGAWIVGGIERTPEKKVFLARVEDRKAKTLLKVLSEHLLPGTIIYTDMWKAYDGIEKAFGLEHYTVNH